MIHTPSSLAKADTAEDVAAMAAGLERNQRAMERAVGAGNFLLEAMIVTSRDAAAMLIRLQARVEEAEGTK